VVLDTACISYDETVAVLAHSSTSADLGPPPFYLEIKAARLELILLASAPPPPPRLAAES
jgi:hypothetical protein